ncbi:orotidine-5'-phosphate decarboxylase [Clostridiaceae bacterium OttesenSCG-928-D20]|nr:orotidine-5'-phosphate decarboxylase [Clostridiaceae bacterium OttesenSCG-928-D20]
MMKDVIIALDFQTGEQTLEFLEKFGHLRPYVKIGMELFYAEGPGFVRTVKNRGHKIFLDLKLHDIPNTVKGGMKSLSSLGVDMTNLHASGGSIMMKQALEGLTREDGTRPVLIAVTQLTSTSEQLMRDELLISESLENTVISYAKNAKSSGLDGIVCSPLEGGKVKKACGDNFITVTPGIRFPDSKADDQSRITTPERARELGSDYIVVGRPITAADDPKAAYERCVREFLGE